MQTHRSGHSKPLKQIYTFSYGYGKKSVLSKYIITYMERRDLRCLRDLELEDLCCNLIDLHLILDKRIFWKKHIVHTFMYIRPCNITSLK